MLHVAERAQHPGDVPQRRLLGAALLEAVARLALEIDDDEVIARHQHLAEVVVAMDADLQALRRLARQGVDARQQLIALRQRQTKVVEFLLSKGAKIGGGDTASPKAMHEAILRGQIVTCVAAQNENFWSGSGIPPLSFKPAKRLTTPRRESGVISFSLRECICPK